jgi:hypothetical protein
MILKINVNLGLMFRMAKRGNKILSPCLNFPRKTYAWLLLFFPSCSLFIPPILRLKQPAFSSLPATQRNGPDDDSNLGRASPDTCKMLKKQPILSEAFGNVWNFT